MDLVARILVALLHLYILYLEMFVWTRPSTLKTFGTTPEQAASSRLLAANKGLYNGFLAAGLTWGLLHPNAEIGQQVQVFFLLCVVVAGVYGGLTVRRQILYVQALPAVIALLAVWFF